MNEITLAGYRKEQLKTDSKFSEIIQLLLQLKAGKPKSKGKAGC